MKHLAIPNSDRYWLKNARVPTCLLAGRTPNGLVETRDGLSEVDIKIGRGKIAWVLSTQNPTNEEIPSVDLHQKIVLPGFADIHTHLDKGHIWERIPFPEINFQNALAAVRADADRHWNREDVYRRMEFGVRCAYAHGTRAIRTHIDCFGEQAEISLDAFSELQKQWRDRVTLQAVSLVTLDYYQTPAGVALADKLAEVGATLGGVAYPHPELDAQLDRAFELAKERGLDLDFHVDETGDPDSNCLHWVAAAALRHQFQGRILCGHCCSLAVQTPETVADTLAVVKAAGIGIVSLPSCNLYLQDRVVDRTPRWRGVTILKELQNAGIPIALASDNCRDPFHGFGDLDALEVFQQAVRIAHLDSPYGHWFASVAKTAADLIGLPEVGRIAIGLDADLIIFKARSCSELLSRPQSDRLVLQRGQAIAPTLPDYEELDDLVGEVEFTKPRYQ